MIANRARMTMMAAAFLALAGSAPTAFGQGNTFNPYGNSGYADYREFGTPMYSNNPSLPGQAVLNGEPIIGRPRANSFQQYTDSLEGRGTDPAAPTFSRGVNSGLPYFQAYRQYDREYNRAYRPNVDADKGFDARLKKRDLAYSKAMEEKDPVKRARLLRLLEQDSLDRAPAPRARAAAPAAGAANRTGVAPAASNRAPNPSTRRTPAPLPFSTGTPNAAGRAPAPPSGPGNSAPGASSTTSPAPDYRTIATPPPGWRLSRPVGE